MLLVKSSGWEKTRPADRSDADRTQPMKKAAQPDNIRVQEMTFTVTRRFFFSEGDFRIQDARFQTQNTRKLNARGCGQVSCENSSRTWTFWQIVHPSATAEDQQVVIHVSQDRVTYSLHTTDSAPGHLLGEETNVLSSVTSKSSAYRTKRDDKVHCRTEAR